MTDISVLNRDRHKILIVDDTLANIEILHKILQGDYDLYFAKNGPDGLRVVMREHPDLILLDVMMPDMDGYQVCSLLKSDPKTADIPVIFITALGSEEDEAKGLGCGAIDYITKPISPPIVKARVKNHLEMKKNRDILEALTLELSSKNKALTRMAREDALTGLPNRRHFNETIYAEINRARTSQYLSLILCDVDFFKSYNDHYGHIVGDKCLQVIGGIMLATFKRAGDLPARYGGEEFAVILPDTTPDQAGQLAERLRQTLIDHAIPHAYSGVSGCVTLSAGVVGAPVTRERTAEWFISEADRALYTSKEKGRNQVTVVTYD
ncbi:diguanylate cyclase domain-containing protein [Geomesophilobacter sediminis]|uniref:diguanylate cyclase n=1 Tax=Geomesophilobacter sediminis TaxID=2798584 RepID=A0A8J7LUU0_9BACT|nr:diguanylate cyclase [Geomesophilobacter sediminis]MBJ6724120.1 diguanylate cyclase [Geomesophilobacter sediminis]